MAAGIRIICVGSVTEPYYKEGVRHYLRKIGRRVPVRITECRDEPTPDRAGQALRLRILDLEGERILSCINRADHVIALCIDGKQTKTDRFGECLRKRLKDLSFSGGDLVFVIGGSLGLSDRVTDRADEKLSFSALTFPHQMMRVMVCQQIAAAVCRVSCS